MVKHIADRVAVMYLGQIVEIADKQHLYATPQAPLHPGLLASIPVPRPGPPTGAARSSAATYRAPSNPPPGCRFHTRCPHVMEVCRRLEPKLLAAGPGQAAACHLVNPPEASAPF